MPSVTGAWGNHNTLLKKKIYFFLPAGHIPSHGHRYSLSSSHENNLCISNTRIIFSGIGELGVDRRAAPTSRRQLSLPRSLTRCCLRHTNPTTIQLKLGILYALEHSDYRMLCNTRTISCYGTLELLYALVHSDYCMFWKTRTIACSGTARVSAAECNCNQCICFKSFHDERLNSHCFFSSSTNYRVPRVTIARTSKAPMTFSCSTRDANTVTQRVMSVNMTQNIDFHIQYLIPAWQCSYW